VTVVIALITFAAVALLVSYIAQPKPDEVRRRILEGTGQATESELRAERSFGRRLVRPMLQGLGSNLSRLLPQNLVHSLETTIVQAGEPISLATFLAIWALVSSAAIFFVVWLISTFPDWGFLRFLVVGGLIILYGIGTPYLLLRRRANKRKTQIERALPDAIDLLLTCVEAGLGVDAAFALLAQRTRGPLTVLLTEYLKQVGLGRSRREALEDIARQSGAPGLNRLATVVAQATAVGATMGDVLRLQAEELRAARRLKAQEAASRAPIWMTIPLALCFMPAMVAVIVVPSILHLIDSIHKLGLHT
jgi:tight adherence protein C